MRRFVTICISLLVASVLAAPVHQSAAQTARITIQGMSKSKFLARGMSGSSQVSTGLRVVGKGTVVYLSADTTGQGSSLSFAWSFTGKPAASGAAFDNPSGQFVQFRADSAGTYAVRLTVGASTKDTTILASTYTGVSSSYPGCALGCHTDKVTAWQSTKHAQIFQLGVTGQLEVDAFGRGTYSPGCVSCHTTGSNQSATNGNFASLAHQNGWDTTWYKSAILSGGSYYIPNGDTTIWHALKMSYPNLVATGNIGCESCHGPGNDHHGDKTAIGRSLDAGVCNQCHDAPTHHMIGSEWASSVHAAYPNASHANTTGCFPCHSGSAFAKWTDNKASPGWSAAADGGYPLTCSSCHDPHGNGNPNQLRTVSVDSLMNGYKPAAGDGGKGQLCMNCHHSRYSAAKRVTNTAPYYGFVDRYGPHGNPQADMFFGQNAYQYGDANLTGLRTHASVPDACVTCHMSGANHSWNMVDTSGNDVTTACQSCHGSMTSFDDIQAPYDYDGNGVIEGVQTEVQSLMNKLKARLPLDPTTGEPTLAMKDSLLVKNHPEYVRGIYTYTFVKNDGSMGVHNAKYAVALLQKALGTYPLDVKTVSRNVPGAFTLEQNYPNPFNPTTNITFSLPKEESVKLEVYDILGRLVKTLASTQMASGTFTITWDGTDEANARVATGMYLYRLQAGSFSAVKKMLMVK